jgi:hypothetical protein
MSEKKLKTGETGHKIKTGDRKHYKISPNTKQAVLKRQKEKIPNSEVRDEKFVVSDNISADKKRVINDTKNTTENSVSSDTKVVGAEKEKIKPTEIKSRAISGKNFKVNSETAKQLWRYPSLAMQTKSGVRLTKEEVRQIANGTYKGKIKDLEIVRKNFKLKERPKNGVEKATPTKYFVIERTKLPSITKYRPKTPTKSNMGRYLKEGARDVKNALKARDESGMITTAFSTAQSAKVVFKGSQAVSAVVWKTVPILAVGAVKGVKITANAVTGKYQIKRRIRLAPRLANRAVRQMKYKVVSKATIVKDSITQKAVAVNKVLGTDVKILAGNAQKAVAIKATAVKKVLETPITKEHVKKAMLMTAVVGGKAVKTTAIVSGTGILKTAKVSVKAYDGISNAFSKSDNELVSSTGTLMKGYRTAGRAGKTAVKTTYKATKTTVKTTYKAGRGILKTARSIKAVGWKKTGANIGKNILNKTGKTVVKATQKTVQLVANLAQMGAKKILLPIIIIVVLAAGMGQMMTTPVQGVAGYLESTLGWLFNWLNKSGEKDEKSAFESLCNKANGILNNNDNRNQHINALKSTLPAFAETPLSDSWKSFMQTTDFANTQNSLEYYILSAEAEKNNVSETFYYDGYTVTEVMDYESIKNDFKVTNYNNFFAGAFFEKFPVETEMTPDNITFTDDEIKNYLLKWDSFTGVANGYSILKDYVTATVTSTPVDTVTTETVDDGEVDNTAARQPYLDEISRLDGLIKGNEILIAQYLGSIATYPSSAPGFQLSYWNREIDRMTIENSNYSVQKSNLEATLPPEKIKKTKEITVTHRSYTITITYTPHLKEVSVNPKDYKEDIPENQELFDKFAFATSILNEL